MPEGPEIRRTADRLARVLEGQRIERAFFYHNDLKPFATTLRGAHVTSVSSASKALLTSFDCGLTLYTHNQLYGKWMIRRRQRQPKTKRSLRVAIETQEAKALLYSASDIEVWPTRHIRSHPYISRLGPEALDPRITPEPVIARLQDPRFRRRSLAGLLLDQTFVAGLGNYLRSEILFFSGLHPARKPVSLSGTELNHLAENILHITRRAYVTAGTTNFPDTVEDLKSQGKRREQFRFAVFERSGQPCYTCNEAILKGAMSGRRIYYCPVCQRGGN